MLKDPDSFVLETVSVDAFEDKKQPDKPHVCYFSRAHNYMGGYGDTGRAYLDSNGTVRVFDSGTVRVFDNGRWLAADMVCNPKHGIDVTAQVKTALASSLAPQTT
jgi:hypothetical protein